MAGYVIADVGVKDAAGCVVLEFPSLAEARRWSFSDEYKPAKEMRFRTALSNVRIVEGA